MREMLSLDDIRKLDNFIPTLSGTHSHIFPYKIQFVKHHELSTPALSSPKTRAHTLKNALTSYAASKHHHLTVTAKNRTIAAMASPEPFIHFVNKYRRDIDTVYAPVNDVHEQNMLYDKNIAIRKSLFRNKFRFRATITPWADEERVNELVKFCNESMDESFFEGSIASDWVSNYHSYTDNTAQAILFKHAHERVPLKMVGSDIILQFQQVVLTTEVVAFSKLGAYR